MAQESPAVSADSAAWRRNENRLLTRVNRLLLLIVILFTAAFHVWLYFDMRIPRGHDGLDRFFRKYFFMNGVVSAGETPQWIPYVLHGMLANQAYLNQGSIFQSALLLVASVLPGFDKINAFAIFYADTFFDEVILIVGIWLLGKYLFDTVAARAFAALSVIGSTVWMEQSYFNLQAFHTLPLILYFGHRLVETKKWRYGILAGNLLGLQLLGGIIYFLPVTMLIIVTYAATMFVARRSLGEAVALIKRPAAITALVVTAITGLSVIWLARVGDTRPYTFRGGRDAAGRATLESFMTYGGPMKNGVWFDLITGYSPETDYTSYLGVLAIPFFFAAFFSLKRKQGPLVTVLATLFLLARGGVASVIFYYVWPLMSYYRHLGLLVPCMKLFAALIAARGFEVSVAGISRRPIVLAIGLLGIVAVFDGLVASHADRIAGMIRSKELWITYGIPDINSVVMREAALRSIVIALGGAVFLFVLARQKISSRTAGLCLLLMTASDLAFYRVHEARSRTVRLEPNAWALARFTDFSFVNRRESGGPHGERASLLEPILRRSNRGAFYPTMDGFTFSDRLSPFARNDSELNQDIPEFWLEPLDNLKRACAGVKLGDYSVWPKGEHNTDSRWPSGHPAYLAAAGASRDKIQFFKRAIFETDSRIIAARIFSDTQSETLYLTDARKVSVASPIILNDLNDSISGGASESFVYTITNFSPNRVRIRSDAPSAGWLFYSDVWHPWWTATVNGVGTVVYKANLAYKAVAVPAGRSEVEFRFFSRRVNAVRFLLQLNAMAWCMVLLWYGYVCFRESRGG